MNIDDMDLAQDLAADISAVKSIESVPTILDVVCRTTGMRFAAVARVTDARWVACSVLDQIDFGLKPGDELRVDTTICHEIHQSREAVIIDHVEDDSTWCTHPTPAMYGFQSYISMPIILADDSFFGTLCAIDPRPARLSNPETIGMFRLFAELIAKHLDDKRKLATSEAALAEERELSELREQFLAVLGHDLREPMRAITCFSELLLKTTLTADAVAMASLMRDSALRMRALTDNLLDLARGRLRGGLPVYCDDKEPLEPVLRAVVAELTASYPQRPIELSLHVDEPVLCDRARLAQLFANLLSNAFTYGVENEPVRVTATGGTGHFELSVMNAGNPIPPSAIERLFQPFYRNAEQHNREGLGLGLYIAHEIAKGHGGELTVTSTEKETCFTFRMPATSANA